MIRRVLGWGAVAVLVGFVLFAVGWRLDGGRWVRVETPSMGTVAPVGTLLWVTPVDAATLRPGDFITFHPPGSTATYSHRVESVGADGTLTTRGVLTAVDPWRISPADVVGEVRMRWPGMGWAVAGAPLLLVGGCVVMAVRALLARRWRTPVTLVLAAVVLAVTLIWLQPLIGAQRLAFAADPAGGATASYVGTGLLPVRLHALGGASVVLHPGEVGSVHVPRTDGEAYRVRLSAGLPRWWWLVLVLVCFVPALSRLLVGSEGEIPSPRVESRHRSPGAAR
ncbi:S24/S26 family peptidase [Nocardioides sp.]|uniref:S24/S26 family peptidase n=1 Tax=Nocardioides sp. TaxID=35761 RepID=UPI00260851A7|nr:S24/S26 family peptidase [Nocardioides sp.]